LAQTAKAAGAQTPSGSEFDSPSGLAFGAGNLWVTNLDGNSVTEIDPSSGAWLNTFSGSSYDFDQPTAILSVGADLFVTNAGGSVTELQASNGSAVRVISGSQFDFSDPVAIAASGATVIVLSAGDPSADPAVRASITEIDAITGDLVLTESASKYGFDDPMALTVTGGDLFVANNGNNSVTEANIATGTLVRILTTSIGSPDGIAAGDGHVWVVDSQDPQCCSSDGAVTEIEATTGAVLGVFDNGTYGFNDPGVAIEPGSSVFIASPYGSSPMITKVSPKKVAKTGNATWYVCNTNGPYYFSNVSALAVSDKDLWVASATGANNPNSAAATGSLTELSTKNAALITTLPS
jgi:hypothetical protein